MWYDALFSHVCYCKMVDATFVFLLPVEMCVQSLRSEMVYELGLFFFYVIRWGKKATVKYLLAI